MSTCVQVFFYSDFAMATKDTLKKFYKSVATEISFRWLGKAVNQVIDATIYIKVRKNAKRFMATLICHKTIISPISSVCHASSVGHAKRGLAMQYSWNISLYHHKSRRNKYKTSRLRLFKSHPVKCRASGSSSSGRRRSFEFLETFPTGLYVSSVVYAMAK